MNSPSLLRRLACQVYESLLLLAVLFVASIPFVALAQHLMPSGYRELVWIYWLVIAGIYFALFWLRGQTLAMKTWHLRLESGSGGLPSLRQVVKRYLLACLLWPISWLWALFAKDHQFLHDHLAGTRLVNVVPPTR